METTGFDNYALRAGAYLTMRNFLATVRYEKPEMGSHSLFQPLSLLPPPQHKSLPTTIIKANVFLLDPDLIIIHKD